MKGKIALGVALLLAPALAASPAMSQGGGGSMSTAFAVQNLGNGTANVQVDFYNTAGQKTNTLSESIEPGANYNFDQRYSSGDPGTDPFQGSAIVSSDQPIGAAANMMRTGGSVPSYESYNALDSSGIGQEIMLPQVLKNVSSAGLTWNTTIVVQNTDIINAANVQLVFTPDPNINPAVGGTLTTPYTYTIPGGIPGGGTAYVDQSTTPGDAEIGSIFFGSVRVISDRDVATMVYSDGGGQILLAYPSYAAGTTDYIALPSIYKEIVSLGDSYSTAILIVNFGNIDATVEIEYLPIVGTVSGKDTVTVPAKAALNVDQRYDAPSITSPTFMGGAVLKCTNAQPIAAMVNLRGGTRYGMTYGGIMGGGMTAYIPISYKEISSAGYSWSSTIIVYNFDRAAGDATVNFTFYPTAGGTIADTNNYTVSDISQFDLRYTTVIAAETSFIGAVKVTSVGVTPRNIGVMVQTRGAGGLGDALMAFLGLMP